jgi:hypothetical protein
LRNISVSVFRTVEAKVCSGFLKKGRRFFVEKVQNRNDKNGKKVCSFGPSSVNPRFQVFDDFGKSTSGCPGDPKLVLSTQNLKLVLSTQSHASEGKTEICVVGKQRAQAVHANL